MMNYKKLDKGERGMGAGVTDLEFENGFSIRGIINNSFWFSEDKSLVVCSLYDCPTTVFNIGLKKEIKVIAGHTIRNFIELTEEYVKFNDGIGTVVIKLTE